MRKIVNAVRGSKDDKGKVKIYTAGMERQLAEDADQKALDRLVSEGFITGDWKSFQTSENFLSFEETMKRFEDGDSSEIVFESLRYWQQQKFEKQTEEISSEETEIKTEVKTSKTAKAKEGNNSKDDKKSTPLPEGFPGLEKFSELNLKTVEEVEALTAEQLQELGFDQSTAEAALAFGK